MTLKALIFDFDGVIIDTETPEYQIWQWMFARFGVDIPLSDWEKGMGSSLDAFDPLVYLEQRLEKPMDRRALKQEHHQALLDALSRQHALPGIEAMILAARRQGMKLAVASSSGIDWVQGNLDRLGLLKNFDALCTSEDVELVKPHPALYQLAVSRLGISAKEAVAFEDSPNGIRAANAARIFCVAIPTPISASLDLTHANYIAASLDQLSLERLMRLVE
jgi:putative hydrolase of the HAD superfamily